MYSMTHLVAEYGRALLEPRNQSIQIIYTLAPDDRNSAK